VHPVIYGDNVHLSVKRTPEFQGHMTPQNARKTRSFKIRKRRLAHSFPLTAFKINISIIFMQYKSVKCLTNNYRPRSGACFSSAGNNTVKPIHFRHCNAILSFRCASQNCTSRQAESHLTDRPASVRQSSHWTLTTKQLVPRTETSKTRLVGQLIADRF
jgi:hypothetical protein